MANIDKKFIDWYTLQRPDIFLSSYGKEMALQAYKRGPPSLVYMLQHSLHHVSYDDCRSRQPCYTHFWMIFSFYCLIFHNWAHLMHVKNCIT